MKKYLFALPVLAALALFLGAALAQVPRNEILDDVQIEEKTECAHVHIAFNLPVRYTKHFPEKSGNEVRIQLEVLAANPTERDALLRRESLLPPESDVAAIEEIMYEGDYNGAPFLTIFFTHPVRFIVKQGTDFRSIDITVLLPTANAHCIDEQ